MDDIQILDTIQADQIEDGDQIAVYGDHLEDVTISDHATDPDLIVVMGYSHDEGDRVAYDVRYSDSVDVWSV